MRFISYVELISSSPPPLQLFTVDVTKKALSPLVHGPDAPLPGLPISLLAGSTAGVVSTILTYPLELVKTRLTVEVRTHLALFLHSPGTVAYPLRFH